MKIIKRDGREVPFDYTKIKAAIEAANAEVKEKITTLLSAALGIPSNRIKVSS